MDPIRPALIILAIFAVTAIAKRLLIKKLELHTAYLRESYRQALSDGDEDSAREAGRKYFKSMHGDELTSADEHAIERDIAKMRR